MLEITKIKDLLKYPINRVTNVLFEGKFFHRIAIHSERGIFFYCEVEQQVIKVVGDLVTVEYRILTEISPNVYQPGYLDN